MREGGMTKGWRNLVLLGTIAILIASFATGISLAIYHNSGDIYLDRSRPGFLPDEEEIGLDEVQKENFEFSKSGKITNEVLGEYVKALEAEVEIIDSFEKPFSAEALSDERLGI